MLLQIKHSYGPMTILKKQYDFFIGGSYFLVVLVDNLYVELVCVVNMGFYYFRQLLEIQPSRQNTVAFCIFFCVWELVFEFFVLACW
jgi:hypothetical protein